MNLKHQKLPKKSKRIHKDQVHSLSNKRKIVLKEKKDELEVDQNIISYRELNITTKRIFITAIKQCIQAGFIDQIFTYPRNLRSKGKGIVINDIDANHLIWKMLRILSTEECKGKLEEYKQKLVKKEREIIEYRLMKSKLIDSSIALSKKCDEMVEDENEQRRQILDLVQKIQAQIKDIQAQQRKTLSKQQNLRQKISIYDASIEIGNKNNKCLRQNLDRAIRQMIRELISQSIIAIVQVPLQKNSKALPVCEQVYVIFQQCYPTATIKYTDIIRILGTSLYLQKCEKISKSISKPQQKQDLAMQTLTMCHNCLEITQASELTFCRNIVSGKQINPYCSFDVQMYHQNVIQSDYFSQPKKSAILPYFLYNKDQKGQLCCNRAFCKKCIKNCDNNQGQFICPFCKGDCNCRRCDRGIQLVKTLAHDLEFDSEMQKNHYNVLNIFHEKPSKYCEDERLSLRTYRDAAQFYLLFPYLRRRLSPHAQIRNISQGQNQQKKVRWSRQLQERFSHLITPDDQSQQEQQSSSVDSRFRDPRYRMFEHWRNI